MKLHYAATLPGIFLMFPFLFGVLRKTSIGKFAALFDCERGNPYTIEQSKLIIARLN